MSDPAPAPSPRNQEAPSLEDIITGSIQELLDQEAREAGEDTGHVVTSWVLVANNIMPDGQSATKVHYDDQVGWTEILGLLRWGTIMAENGLIEDTRGED